MNTEELKTYAGLFGSMNDILRYLAQGNDDDLLVKYLSTSQEYAYYCARYVIKGRWPEGEKAIAKDPMCAYRYASLVINDRFPEGESAISKVPAIAYQYARFVIGGRWPPGEKAIARDPHHAYYYAKDVIYSRFPEGEKAIAKDSCYAYLYATKVIKGRFARYKFLCMASFYKHYIIRYPATYKFRNKV